MQHDLDNTFRPRAPILFDYLFKQLLLHLLLVAKLTQDLRQISTTAMINLQDCRALLGQMHESSLIEIQQIPRSADRAANRTFQQVLVLVQLGLSTLLQIAKSLVEYR
jgi:hypothetical protein